ncbi:Cytochrome P450 monooxygenase 1 [Colletotrichum aenigma]|uniref:Cytochrome P450 monooxygenase 1 n=1 Tax=Colletotrichum aenigma TaxID=1215731 RepID=UPI001872F6E2|nr:Cytochrome P450 monooxygenase 1 [Colletotrichum aenigma]KAF5485433.1 Cytochrome P450 monooxygenase 1 [Colletotrichum aenigma]
MGLQHSFWTAIAACAALMTIYTVSCIFYNLFLHPLRHYPGPISMRATRWTYCYRLIRGALPMDVLELHKTYGDVVRVAPDELAYCNVNAWKDIMGHRSAGSPSFEKAMKFYRPTGEQSINIVNTNGAEHAMLRRQLSHGFSERSLRDQQPLIMKAKLERRMELGKKEGGRPDLIEGLLKQKEKLNISFETLVANSNTLIIGGSETTATLLGGVTYYLLMNRHCLKKLADEVRTAFKTEEEIDLVSVNKLTYMLACLNEALRVYPPVSMGLPRVTPKGGATICGKFVSEDTIVSIHQWAINHNEKYFKDPYGFHPERFMGEDEFASDNREAFQPFHIGSRNCLGRNLAYVEMRLILARLIWNFDVQIDEACMDWAEKQQIFILWDKGPLEAHLTPVVR